ncbi:Uncharacterised protein [Mycobacteroides abscessus subsp. abscessus]|nr:Uncharacterised protein [Mycobacteroides abscessus subsp. abscessus]
MDSVGAGLLSGLQDLAEVQVGLGGGVTADAEGLVGEVDVGGISVGFGVDRDAAQSSVLRRADHPNRNLAAVGDEYLADLRAGVIGHRASWF